MRAIKPLLLLLVLAVAGWLFGQHPAAPVPQDSEAQHSVTAPGGSLPSFLPPQAADTLRLIASGGPFPHRQDGVVFQNREGRLPAKPEGYYHEYTVDTPGLDYRGARRIITGGTPPQIYYYTDDHYRTFRPFEVHR